MTPTTFRFDKKWTEVDAAAIGSWVYYVSFGVVSVWSSFALKSPDIQSYSLIAMHVIGLFLISTTALDPGYIAITPSSKTSDEMTQQPVPAGAAPDTEQIVDGFKLHYCQRCEFYQPLRTKHCRECKRCVSTFDHHCFFIGGCVGERNHRKFFFMLLWNVICMVWNFVIIIELLRNKDSVSPAGYWVVVAFFGFGLLPAGCVFGLLGYHMYLIISGQTTWEHMSTSNISYLKGVPAGLSLFSRGAFRNCREFFLRNSETPIRWQPMWQKGQEAKFSVFDNKYYSCC